MLQKIQTAARKLDYSGVFTYQQGPVMQSTRIVHVVDGTGERERLEMLDGAPGEFVRHNDTMQRLTHSTTILTVQTPLIARFLGLLTNEGRTIPASYLITTTKHTNTITDAELHNINIK